MGRTRWGSFLESAANVAIGFLISFLANITMRHSIGLLISDPDHYKQIDPPNGWGDNDGFMEFLKELL